LPSSTSAIAGIRRAIFASRTFADAARNSLAVKSFRVISIAAIAASFAPMAVRVSLIRDPPPESKIRPVGFNP
jgi:hypothetical protein